MVPVELLSLKHHIGNHSEDNQRDTLLDDLQLYQREWPTVTLETNAVGRYLTAIFEEGDGPTEGDDTDKRPVAAHARLLQLEVSVPSQRHEDVAQHQ